MLLDNDLETLKILEDVYRGWEPNEGQLQAGRALEEGKITQFIRWGRKGGKTDYIIKSIARYACLTPNAGCYYFCPQANQAREILWETGRLQRAIPKKYVKTIRSNDMRIILKNGSFIKLDGSDNYEKHRGTEGHFLVYDEFKDFDRRFHEAIDPNRGVHNAPLLILGTPPVSINEDRNYEQYHELQNQCKRDKDKFYLELSSFVNAHNVPKPDPGKTMAERTRAGVMYLKKKKQELIDRGEEYRWEIEYMAKNVTMGKHAVFPMLSEKFVFDHEIVHPELLKDEHKLEWFCIADPGTSTVFGVIFVAFNPYTREFWILDELYVKDRNETSTNILLPKMIEKMYQLAPNLDPENDWIKVADEAAAWFITESSNQANPKYNLTFIETEKYYNKKENGLSLMKDCLLYNTMLISSKAKNLYWEMEQYTCMDGKYPKKWDHLIDTVRYFLAETNYDMKEALEAKHTFKTKKLRNEKDLYSDIELDDDWTEIYND